VIAPANTGKAKSNKQVVIKIEIEKREMLFNSKLLFFIFKIVEIKLIELIIEEIPAICNEKIIISIDELELKIKLVRGGYIVQPTPLRILFIEEFNIKIREGMSNQKLILFKRGKHISIEFIIIGINQFPNPPIIAGITIKKIIIIACLVTKEL
jgi:hypothetical protein